MSNNVIAISYTDFENHGCVNCNCSSVYGIGYRSNYSIPVKCHECQTLFVILDDNMAYSDIGFGDEYPKLQIHPKQNPTHIWEKPDERPTNGIGEFYYPRGLGTGRYGEDMAGFVKTKQSGERIVEMFKSIIGIDCKTFLDYRENEPTWIQVKVQAVDNIDLQKLYSLTVNDCIITIEKIKESFNGKIL